MTLVWVRHRTDIIYWFCIIFFIRVQQISFEFNATAYTMLTFDTRQVFAEKINFFNKISNLHFTLHVDNVLSLCFLHFVCLTVNSPATCFFLITNQHFVVLFALISSCRETCCTQFFSTIEITYF